MRNALYLISTILLLFAWGGEAAQAQGANPQFRLANFSTGVGAINVYINGQLAQENLSFPELTPWRPSQENELTFTITPAGASQDELLIPEQRFNLRANGHYTLALIGEAVRNTVTLHIIEEDFSEISEGETRITLFNAITGPGSTLISLTGNRTLLMAGVAYPSPDGATDGVATIDIIARGYNLSVSETGNPSNVIFSLDNTVLGRGRHYFIAAIGSSLNPDAIFVTNDITPGIGAPNPDVQQAGVEGGTTYLRVGHFSPDTAPLDLYINGTLSSFTDVGYVGLTGWVSLPTGVYEFAFVPTGEPIEEAIIGPFDLPLIVNEWNTLAIIGFAENNGQIARKIVEDYSPIPRGESRLTFFHAVPDTTPIDVVINDQVFIGALNFPGNAPVEDDGADAVTVAANRVDIEMTEAGNLENVYITLFDTPLTPGNHYFIAAINSRNSIDYYLQAGTQAAVIENVAAATTE